MLLSAVKLQSGVFVCFFFAATVPAVLLFTANKRQSGSVPSRQAPRRGKKPGFSAGVFFSRNVVRASYRPLLLFVHDTEERLRCHWASPPAKPPSLPGSRWVGRGG